MKTKLSAFLGAAFLLGVSSGSSQLFENLQSLAGLRYPVGDPALTSTNSSGDEIEGPKDIAVAELRANVTARARAPSSRSARCPRH